VRALARIESGDLALRSRNAIDITKRYPELASLPDALASRQAIIDGEIVAPGCPRSQQLRTLAGSMHVRAPSENLASQIPAVYFAFDLLYCDGYDLRDTPLLERKQLLQRLLLHRNGFATPIISWNTEKSCSRWRNKMVGRYCREARRQPVRFRSKPVLG